MKRRELLSLAPCAFLLFQKSYAKVTENSSEDLNLYKDSITGELCQFSISLENKKSVLQPDEILSKKYINSKTLESKNLQWTYHPKDPILFFSNEDTNKKYVVFVGARENRVKTCITYFNLDSEKLEIIDILGSEIHDGEGIVDFIFLENDDDCALLLRNKNKIRVLAFEFQNNCYEKKEIYSSQGDFILENGDELNEYCPIYKDRYLFKKLKNCFVFRFINDSLLFYSFEKVNDKYEFVFLNSIDKNSDLGNAWVFNLYDDKTKKSQLFLSSLTTNYYAEKETSLVLHGENRLGILTVSGENHFSISHVFDLEQIAEEFFFSEFLTNSRYDQFSTRKKMLDNLNSQDFMSSQIAEFSSKLKFHKTFVDSLNFKKIILCSIQDVFYVLYYDFFNQGLTFTKVNYDRDDHQFQKIIFGKNLTYFYQNTPARQWASSHTNPFKDAIENYNFYGIKKSEDEDAMLIYNLQIQSHNNQFSFQILSCDKLNLNSLKAQKNFQAQSDVGSGIIIIIATIFACVAYSIQSFYYGWLAVDKVSSVCCFSSPPDDYASDVESEYEEVDRDSQSNDSFASCEGMSNDALNEVSSNTRSERDGISSVFSNSEFALSDEEIDFFKEGLKSLEGKKLYQLYMDHYRLKISLPQRMSSQVLEITRLKMEIIDKFYFEKFGEDIVL